MWLFNWDLKKIQAYKKHRAELVSDKTQHA